MGVNHVVLEVRRSLPVYPDKQTFSEPGGMSQRCQKRSWHLPSECSKTELPARDWLGWSRPLSHFFQGQCQVLRQSSSAGRCLLTTRLREVVVPLPPLLGALRRQTIHSPSICIQAKLRRQRKRKSRNAQSWLRRKKIGLAAEPKWCHFFIRAWSQGGSLSELAKALVQA
jgi:hypothetical protein